jgi:hypothetical protein
MPKSICTISIQGRMGCFTASPYGLRHGKPGTLTRTDEDSGGPAAECYARVLCDLKSRSSRGGSCGDGESCSRAAAGGLPPEERRDRAADPACAHASHAGTGPGPACLGRNITTGHHPCNRLPPPAPSLHLAAFGAM